METEGRCPRCVRENCSGSCRKQLGGKVRAAAVFENIGPAKALLSHLRQGKEYLFQLAASFMIVQLFHLEWPFPHKIVPLSQSWLDRLLLPCDPADLLALALERLLLSSIKKEQLSERLYFPALRKLEKEEQLFHWKRPSGISDQTLLIVTDTLLEMKSMESAVRSLQQGFPSAIFILALCYGGEG